jgi:hypothetical protein
MPASAKQLRGEVAVDQRGDLANPGSLGVD